MKLLHMAHVRWYNAEAQYALDLASALAERGHEQAVFTQQGSPVAQKAEKAGLKVVEDSGFNAKGPGALKAFPSALALKRLLVSESFDAVLAHRSEGLPLIAWACRAAGTPLVRVRGDMRPARRGFFNRKLYTGWLSGVVASNSWIEGDLKAAFGEGLTVTTIPGGVDVSLFSPEGSRSGLRQELGFGEKDFLVGILGRIGSVKGHDDFIEAARLVAEKRPGVSFVVLVKEPHEHQRVLEERVAAIEALGGRFAFVGHCADLPAVLRDFDLGVVASTGSEANCRVGLEWLASGVPLLGTRIGVLPDIVAEGANGFLAPPSNPSGIADKIIYLSENADVAEAMSKKARESAEKKFSMELLAERHEVFLNSLGIGR